MRRRSRHSVPISVGPAGFFKGQYWQHWVNTFGIEAATRVWFSHAIPYCCHSFILFIIMVYDNRPLIFLLLASIRTEQIINNPTEITEHIFKQSLLQKYCSSVKSMREKFKPSRLAYLGWSGCSNSIGFLLQISVANLEVCLQPVRSSHFIPSVILGDSFERNMVKTLVASSKWQL